MIEYDHCRCNTGNSVCCSVVHVDQLGDDRRREVGYAKDSQQANTMVILTVNEDSLLIAFILPKKGFCVSVLLANIVSLLCSEIFT